MGTLHVVPAQNFSAANSSYGFQPNLWSSCPRDSIMQGIIPAVVVPSNFAHIPVLAASTGEWAGVLSTGGVINSLAERGGGISLLSDDADEGAILAQRIDSLMIDTSNRKALWFDARIKPSTIANTTNSFFVGLIDDSALAIHTNGIPITSSDAMADCNWIGFYRLAGDGDALIFGYKADGVTAVTPVSYTLTAAWTRIGFRFDGQRIFIYHNNLENPTKVAESAIGYSTSPTNFPNDKLLRVCVGIYNAAGVGSLGISHLNCVQLV